MKKHYFRYFAATLLIACTAGDLRGRDWTRFRGPNGSGISDAKTVPVSWTADDYNWDVPLPGSGISSPVVWDEKLYITSAEPDKNTRYLLCLNTNDGTEAWRQAFAFEPYRKHKNNTFASNTPTVDERHVYVLWQEPARSSLQAFDHDGKPAWTVDLGRYKSGHGTGSSPVVYGDMVLVCNDNDGESFLLAVDAATGKELWKVGRIGDRACYSTPCIFEQPGRRTEIIFTHSFRGITGVDAETGRKNWEIDVFGTFNQRAVASPVIFGELVLGSSGFTTSEKNTVAVRPQDGPSGATVEEIYRVTRGAPHVPTPLVYNGLLFLWADNGVVTCVRADNGKLVWQQRVGGNYHGSPVCIDGKLYCIDRDGVVVVLRAAEEYELLARNDLGRESQSTPAVSGGRLYLRTHGHLVSLGGAK